MLKSNKLSMICIMVLGLFAGTALAQTTYVFDGTNYDFFDPPYNANSKITGSFQVNDLLAANSTLDLTAVLQTFSFTDGQATRDQSNTVLCQFDVTTDANSRIQSYSIYMRQNDTGPAENQHAIDIFTGIEQSGFSPSPGGTNCDSIALFPRGSANTTDNSSWTGGATIAVPTLSFYMMLLAAMSLGLMGLYYIRK